mmetsp:Transcript_131469/g.327846  ORF Transcript_131469/g.327846 Transcript_131469/m.327846 type:complete len:1091 (+) Transcript_131469:70-3342(+)
MVAAAMSPEAAAQPLVFWVCALSATVAGLLLAALDTHEVKDSGGHSPAAHIVSCADSADKLFAGLSADGAGLGLLEPLWRLLTPDGALWTLLTLGISGLVASAGNIFEAAAKFLPGAGSPKKQPAAQAHATPFEPEKLKMSFFVEMYAYWGYFLMFSLGVVREYVVRTRALLWRDELTRGYVTRERWNSGWVDFYKQHMYKLIVDCFNRPIANAPDATFDVIERARPGGSLFGPLHDFACTDKVRTCVNLASYNYLGFGGVDEFCVPKARAEALQVGFSSGGPRTEGGTLKVHRDLEVEVAKFLDKEDALVLGMGFATNSTILPALFDAQAGGTGVLVLSDSLNHRSIVEGVRLSGATVRAFEHNSMPALEAELKRAVTDGQPGAAAGKPWRKIFIVVEGIYSMEGDFCRLREIVTLKNRYKAFLYLDEAHSIGAVGPSGRGVSELLGVPTSEVDIMMGTFTKSFGSAGGYVAASRAVIDALRRNAPGSVFASAMSPPCAAQALAAFRVISGSEGGSVGAEKLKSIRENSNFFRTRLVEEGFKVLGDVDSPIIPVMLHHPWKMAAFSRECFARGIAVVIVGYPAVPVLFERVRFCISAAHTRKQLDHVMKEIAEVGRKVGVLYEKATEKSVLDARMKHEEEYAAWLRNAPMQMASSVDLAPEVEKWTPEPLVPVVQAKGGLSDIALASTMTVEDKGRLDLRLFDPLEYMKKPAAATLRAIEETMDVYGFGSCGPRGFYGTTRPHMALEAKISEFLGTEAAIAYSAGVATASSVIPALVQPGDRVIIDSEVHLGIRTGLRLCKSQVTWVPHCDMKAVEVALEESATASGPKKEGRRQRTFIVAEALYQRTGRIAPLKELVALKEKHGAFLVLDESLSFGVFGSAGRGILEDCGIESHRVDAIIGSLEHAVAGVGGFCAGRKSLIDHQRLAGAGYCFSASCPPAACAAAAATIDDLAQKEGGVARRAGLQQSVSSLHEELCGVAADCGLPLKLVSSPGSYMQHLRWQGGDAAEGEAALLRVAEACKEAVEGLRVQVCSPGTCGAEASFGARTGAPKAAAPPSLRLCASTGCSREDLAEAAAILGKALREAAA